MQPRHRQQMRYAPAVRKACCTLSSGSFCPPSMAASMPSSCRGSQRRSVADQRCRQPIPAQTAARGWRPVGGSCPDTPPANKTPALWRLRRYLLSGSSVGANFASEPLPAFSRERARTAHLYVGRPCRQFQSAAAYRAGGFPAGSIGVRLHHRRAGHGLPGPCLDGPYPPEVNTQKPRKTAQRTQYRDGAVSAAFYP